jgi:hypothetical protein
MLTRRDAIRVALGIPASISAFPAWAFAAKEFWETKPASEWTSEEVDRMLTKSPWAKEAVVSYNGGGGDFGDGDNSTGWPRGQGGGGGIGGGGIGGPALAEEYQGSVASAGSGAGEAEVRLEEILAGAPRAASSFTGPFAGNPRVPFRKRFALDRAKRVLTPISKNIT